MRNRFDDSKLSPEEVVLRNRWRELVRRNGDKQKKVARAVGLSESAMSRRCTGEDLPSDEELVRLCLHRQLDPEEEAKLLDLLVQARKARDRRESEAAQHPPLRWRELLENRRLVVVTITVIAALIVSGSVWAVLSHQSSSSASPTDSPSAAPMSSEALKPNPSQSQEAWPAAVANAPNGTFLYGGPFKNGHDMQPVASRWNGNALRIVCQEPHGRTIRDESIKKSSAVWSKLDDGNWIPTMYTDLAESATLSEIPPCAY